MIPALALFVPMGLALPAPDPLAYAYPIHLVYWIRSGGKIGHISDGYIMSTESDDRLEGDAGVPAETMLRYRRRADGYEDEHVLIELTPKLESIEKVK